MTILHDLITPPLRAVLTSLSRRRLPLIQGRLKLAGLTSPVEVLRDRWGVPHIYASTLRDAFFTQGFVHAQDRLFQMELNRRTANSRLSELFGPVALDTDRATATFGFRRLGLLDWAQSSPEVREHVLAYTEGVNAYLGSKAYHAPIEYSLVGIKPTPWAAEDTMAFSRVMIWQLSHAWYSEIVRSWLIEKVGPEHAAEWEIHYPGSNPVNLPAGIEFNRLTAEGKLLPASGPFLHQNMGSNSWTVTGARSATGAPFLCNDMHLQLGTPGLWYQVDLQAGSYHATGVSLPGLPLVLVGHNAHVAWGMTLAFTDAEDLFVEDFEPSGSLRYRFGSEWRQAEVAEEVIPVKGRAEPHRERVVITHHGPIISDVVGAPERRLAVCSMALRPGRVVEGWLQLNQATGWDDFVRAMKLIEAPQLNVAYADTAGNIGYWVTGKVPVRARGKGMVPAPGYSGDHEWIDEVPFEEMPHALNPKEGFLVATNNKIIGDDYPHYLGEVWMNGYRARRITEVLTAKGRVGPEEFRGLHVDFTCLPGREFVDRLKGLKGGDPDVDLALRLLRGWNGVLDSDTVGGAVYEVARYSLVRNLLEPHLGVDLTNRMMGQGFHPLLLASSEFYGQDTVAVLRMLDNPGSWWIQHAGGREAAIAASLKTAVNWLRTTLGADSAEWKWGRLHRAVFPHALALQQPLDRIFNCPPLPIGGDTDTPCQTAIAPNDPYDNKAWAPSFRQIVDLGDLSRSLVVSVPGQSGQLGSPHYDDLAKLWIRGDYVPMLWTRAQVEKEVEGKLILEA